MCTDLWVDGTRVRINPHAFWPAGGTGTVRPFPTTVGDKLDGTSGCSRILSGAKRTLTMVWVVFDSPLHDGDSGGPYREGEIDDSYLVPLIAGNAPGPQSSV